MSEMPTQRRRRKRKRKKEDLHYSMLKATDSRWTPNNEQLHELLMVAVREAGNMRRLASALPMKYRHLRRIVNGDTKAVSLRVVDRILVRSSVSHRVRELEWLTAEQLVERGVWKEQQLWVPRGGWDAWEQRDE